MSLFEIDNWMYDIRGELCSWKYQLLNLFSNKFFRICVNLQLFDNNDILNIFFIYLKYFIKYSKIIFICRGYYTGNIYVIYFLCIYTICSYIFSLNFLYI